jgi:hypothetical protein
MGINPAAFDARNDNFGWIELPRIVDAKDGVISVAEVGRHVPFDIKRVYYIYHLKSGDSQRGKHAHRRLQQVLFCLNGSMRLDLDDGKRRWSERLDRPERGAYLGPKLWHEMREFEHNCILMVLASDFFDEADYIRDYAEFRRFIQIP